MDYSNLSVEAQEWLNQFVKRAEGSLVPQMQDSHIAMQIYTGKIDCKFAMEVGVAILLDKPIIVTVAPGCEIPEKLAKVADRFVELDPKNPEDTAKRAAVVVADLIEELESKKSENEKGN